VLSGMRMLKAQKRFSIFRKSEHVCVDNSESILGANGLIHLIPGNEIIAMKITMNNIFDDCIIALFQKLKLYFK
jgi:hypothetical protein